MSGSVSLSFVFNTNPSGWLHILSPKLPIIMSDRINDSQLWNFSKGSA